MFETDGGSITEATLVRQSRVSAAYPATIVTGDMRSISVIVTNLSAGGFRVVSSHDLQIADYVTLQAHPFGEFRAQIRWALGQAAGARFVKSGSQADRAQGPQPAQ